MANADQLEILAKGVDVWNRWRREYDVVTPDLRRADLRGKGLGEADLRRADLSGANLSGVSLRGADLREANLNAVNLTGATLVVADLCKADLTGATLDTVNLARTNLDLATFLSTRIINVDLSATKNLESTYHLGPSSIDINTIFLSNGQIPEEFLRGDGVPDTFITFAASLVGKPIQFYSSFISYSSKDTECAERLHSDLQREGVRCWYAPEDLKIGDEFRSVIDRSIRLHEKLVLLLSAASVARNWVKKEVETAFERENREGLVILFPIRLDDAIMDTDQAWAADIRRTRHIGDFRGWKHHDTYQLAFRRILRDLKAPSERNVFPA